MEKVEKRTAVLLALMAIVVVGVVSLPSESSADSPVQVTEGGVVYALCEGGGEYYAEVIAYDGETAEITIKSAIRNNEIDYPVQLISADIFNILDQTSSENRLKRENITSVTIEENTNLTLPSGMFNGLKNLTTISIGEGFTEIPDYFCYECTQMTSVSMPSTIESIGSFSFAHCHLLENVNLSTNLRTIKESAFMDCNALQTIVIPDNVTLIGPRVFYQCDHLGNVTLGTGLTVIPESAFGGSIISTMTIPARVSDIAENAFPISLESIMVDEVNQIYESKDGAVYKKSDGTLYIWPASKGGEVTLYSNVSNGLFRNNILITKVILRDNVTSIGSNAFEGCKSLIEVSMTNNVQTIGAYAFYNCEGLSVLQLSTNVVSLEGYVFSGCKSLETIDISHVTSLNSCVFQNCSSLVRITLPDSITVLPSSTFSGCTKLEEVNLSHITSIGSYAFKDCTCLQSLTLPEGLQTLEREVFKGCSKLESLYLPTSINSIGRESLKDTGLKVISIGDYDQVISITTTGTKYQVFGSSSLESLSFDNASTSLTPEKVIDFKSSPSLSEITFKSRFTNTTFISATEVALHNNYADKVIIKALYCGNTSFILVPQNSAKELEDPVPPLNMRFAGWYLDSDYSVPYDPSQSLDNDATVYARFVIDSYTMKFSEGIESISNLHAGDVISLSSVSKDGSVFNGWMVNDLPLGAQYIVSARDADESGNILLIASFSEKADESVTFWALSVVGEGIQGKVFCTPTNAIGTYGMITVLPGEFEKATYTVSSNGGYGIISDNCVMVYSIDGKDVTVTVAFQDVGKASEYDVSIVEIVSGEKHGFRATVAAENGYVDDAGEFKIRYVYKTWNADESLWIYATSGVTAGVDDEVITIAAGKSSFATGDFLLDKEGATLVFGYASYSFEDTVAGAAGTVTVTSPVIMSVSEIQAVVGRP